MYCLIVKLDMGMRGAAIATGLAQLFPAIFLMLFIIFDSSWKIQKPVFKLSEIKQIVYNGLSEFLDNISVSVVGFFLNSIIIFYIGSEGLAGYSVAFEISGIVSSVAYGIAEGSQSIIS